MASRWGQWALWLLVAGAGHTSPPRPGGGRGATDGHGGASPAGRPPRSARPATTSSASATPPAPTPPTPWPTANLPATALLPATMLLRPALIPARTTDAAAGRAGSGAGPPHGSPATRPQSLGLASRLPASRPQCPV